MTVTEKRTASGQYRNEYKIVEVMEFVPAPEQMTLMKFFDESEDDEPTRPSRKRSRAHVVWERLARITSVMAGPPSRETFLKPRRGRRE